MARTRRASSTGDLRDTAAALAAARQRLDSLLENSPLAVIEWSCPDLRITRWSPEAERVFGWTAADALGSHVDELPRVHEDDRPLVRSVVADMVAGRRSRNVIRSRNRRKDGSVIHCEWYNSAVTDGAGAVTAVLSLVLDVTALKQHELRVTQLSRLYAVRSRVNETIVRTRNPMVLFGEVCRIVAGEGGRPLAWIGLVEGRTVRPVASAGRAVDYVRGLHVETDGEWGGGPTGSCIREGRPVVNDDFHVDPKVLPWREATSRHGLRSSAAFPLRQGQVVVGALTIYASEPGTFDPEQVGLLEALSADVSYALDAMEQERALRESERGLREADQRKNEFLAILSHELRNPLTPIRASLYVLDSVEPDSEAAGKARAAVNRQVDQLARIVDDLLDVTRITRGKVQIQRTRLELGEVVRRTAADHRAQFASAGVEFDLSLTGEPLWVDADAARIAQAVGNLLHNASKFTPQGGRVTLALEEDVPFRTAVVRVRDTGIGIAPEVLRRLFEPFTQADDTLERSRGGLGLGLALVKGMVELHGGSVEAHSAGPGRGSEFVIRLPTQPEARELEPVPKRSPRPRACRRVLVVEDNVDSADSLRQALTVAGHTVEVAHSGPEGLDRARAFRPDAILCDIGLPGMDGYAVARAVRADADLRGVGLVALTGYALPEDIARARAAGFDEHVAKPPSVARLDEILAAGVARTRP